MEWKIVKSALIEFQMIDKWNPVFNIKSEENLAMKCYRWDEKTNDKATTKQFVMETKRLMEIRYKTIKILIFPNRTFDGLLHMVSDNNKYPSY